jgi:hypothetical protein
MHRIPIALFALPLLVACGDATVKGKGDGFVLDTNQETGPNGTTNAQANSSNGSTSGNVTTNNEQMGPICGYAQVDSGGVCKLQDHLWFTVGTNVYSGQNQFEQTTVVGCTNLAVADEFNPSAADLEVGACSLYVSTQASEPSPSVWERGPLDFGNLSVQLGSESVELEMDENYCFRPVDTIQTAWVGETATISVTGGADIDAFEESMQLPPTPRFDEAAFVNATGAVTIEPDGATDRTQHSLSWSARTEDTNYTVVCSFERGEELTVPAEIVSTIRGAGADNLSVAVTRYENVRLDSGGAHVNGSFTSTYGYTF